jgi:general secretion pathway protein K
MIRKIVKPSRRFFFRSRRGVALILTLMIVGIISASVISFIRLAGLEVKMAENNHSFAQAEILAQAGLKGAMTLLAMDDESVDSANDSWNLFADYAAMAGGFFDEGAFTGRIVDLSAKFDVNSLVDEHGKIKEREDILRRLFQQLELNEDPVGAIIDWIDDNDDIEPGGAEDTYYRGLATPYPCANGPLQTSGQLRLIKGLSDEILYGTEDKKGLLEFITVHSSGQVNINTADIKVLMSLHEDLTETIAQEIIERRIEQPFEKLDELKNITDLQGIWQELVGQKLVSVNSSHFSIVIEATFREARVVVTAIVERNNGVRLIYYRSG